MLEGLWAVFGMGWKGEGLKGQADRQAGRWRNKVLGRFIFEELS